MNKKAGELQNISVIICAYTEKRWQDLVRAVESVQQQDLPPKEIIVVIDHNPVLANLAKNTFERVIVVQNNNPSGLSGARNCGIETSNGDIVAFLDDDAVADPLWLKILTSHYDDSRTMGVGGKIEPLYLDGRPRWFPQEFDWVVGCSYRGLPETVAAVRNLIGCNMSFRREVLQLTGGFRIGVGRIGDYPSGDEETDLCIRSSQRFHGGILVYDPAAKVQHRVPPERASWRYLFQRCYSEGQSKAQLARFVGARDGLASELEYTVKTLPKGIGRGFVDFITRGDIGGLGRMFAIVSGLTATVFGYAVAKAANVIPYKVGLDH